MLLKLKSAAHAETLQPEYRLCNGCDWRKWSYARRQIFTVFAIFLLVEKFQLKVSTFLAIFVLNYALTYLTNPYISRAINKYGEKVVLSLESASLRLPFLTGAFLTMLSLYFTQKITVKKT